MKRKSIISLLVLCMTVGMVTTSCKDMLTPDSERQSYVVAQDTLYSYWGIVKSLQNVAEKYVILNECRGDLVDGSGFVSDSIKAILNFGMQTDANKYYRDGANAYLQIRDYYHIINSCNAYIANADKDRKTGIGRNPYMLKEYAQVLSIRAWVYMQLCTTYGKVPFYTTPMLTTDDINNFMEGQTEMITSEELADKLAPELEEMFNVEYEFGYPQYSSYGGIIHSSKLMFPIPIVLGDLYLMKGGSRVTYENAARWYMKFINSKWGGVIRDATQYYLGDLIEGRELPIYGLNSTSAYTSTSAASAGEEAITVIPSNRGKLDGKVNVDVCRLFGWEPEISVSHIRTDYDETDDDKEDGEQREDVEVAHVYLTKNYERELVPSKGYDNLCDAQNFEIYLGTSDNPYREIVTLEKVGDARRYWTLNGSNQFTFDVNGNEVYGKMVHKMCPHGGFYPTLPVVYRKSTVWLRYAEALNRAGYPSYAFAILKNGLCNHTKWYPNAANTDENPYKMETYNGEMYGSTWQPKEVGYFYSTTIDGFEFLFPTKESEGGLEVVDYAAYKSLDELQAAVEAKFQAMADEYNATKDPSEPDMVPETFDPANVYCKALAYENYPSDYCEEVCYYLNRQEVENSKVDFMNFNGMDKTFIYGNANRKAYYYKPTEKSNRRNGETYNIITGVDTDRFCMGIHERGCGFTLPLHSKATPEDAMQISSYDYVTLVQEKIKESTGLTYTIQDVYANRFDQNVIEAVEDLILDEMGLELAFEGNRFTDIERIAKRRANPGKYLGERIAKRGGTLNSSLYSWLQDKSHWYLPLPQE